MDFDLKYGGKAYGFTVVVNTNEDPSALAERIRKAAAGPSLNATIVGGYEVTPEEMKDMLAKMQEHHEKQSRIIRS